MENNKNKFQQIDEVLIKYLTGYATEKERDIARAWINENPEHAEYFDELKNIYQLTGIIRQPSGFNTEEGWNRVKAGYFKMRLETELKNKKAFRRKVFIGVSLSSAAAILIIIFIGFYGNLFPFKSNNNNVTAYNEVVVPLGAKSKITLSDGTKVWLNAGSKLRYPVDFLSDSRVVYLEGEAYFSVTKNKHKQFIVKTSNLDIKVYGTQFNVKSYPEENLIQTTLVEGAIAIETHSGRNKKIIYLKPNQTATYYKSLLVNQTSTHQPQQLPAKVAPIPGKNIEIKEKVNLVPITSWKDHDWVIVGEELGQLAIQFERRYNVIITFKNESLKKYKFSGTLADETFEQVLKIVQLSAPILYSINGNKVDFRVDPTYQKKYDKMITNKK